MQIHCNVVRKLAPHGKYHTFRILKIVNVHHDLQSVNNKQHHLTNLITFLCTKYIYLKLS